MKEPAGITDMIEITYIDINTKQIVYHGSIGHELSEKSDQVITFKTYELDSSIFVCEDKKLFGYIPAFEIIGNSLILYEDGADEYWEYELVQ